MRRLEKASKPKPNVWSHLLLKLIHQRIIPEFTGLRKELGLNERIELKKLVQEILDAELELKKKDFFKIYNWKRLK